MKKRTAQIIRAGKKLPSPKRKDVLNWLKEIWDEFQVEIVKNSFTGSGYYVEDGVVYKAKTESEYDYNELFNQI